MTRSLRLVLAATVASLVPSLASAQPDEARTQASYRHGVTAELGLGYGLREVSNDDSGQGLAAGVSVGAFVTPRIAVLARTVFAIEGTHNGDYSPMTLPINWTTGLAAQVWVTDRFWLSGGAGVAGGPLWGGRKGLGLEARAGYSFARPGPPTPNTFSVSAAWLGNFARDASAQSGVVVLLGYQRL